MKKIQLFLTILSFLSITMFSQTITSVVPSSVTATGQTIDVMLTGDNTHFDSNGGTLLTFRYYYAVSGGAVAVLNSYAILSATSIKANITIPANAETADYDFYVHNSPDGQINKISGFHVNGIPAKPSFQFSYPIPFFAHQTLDLTIRGHRYPYGLGTHFKDPSTKLLFKCLGPNAADIVVNSMTIKDDSTIRINITTPAESGLHRISISNNIDGEMKGDYKVYDGCASYFTTSYDATTNVFTLGLDSITSSSTKFSWNFGDGTLSTDQHPTHTYAKDSIYTVCLSTDSCWYCRAIGIDENGDPVTKTKGFTIKIEPFKGTTGISKNETMHSISVYPNPGNDFITIETAKISASNKPVLTIYSIEGKRMLQETLIQEKKMLDISSLEKGIYFIQVAGTGKTQHLRFIKD